MEKRWLSKVNLWIGLILLLCGISTVHIWKEEVDFYIMQPEEMDLDLTGGTWIFGVSYENSNEKNYAEIYSADTMDKDGNLDKVHAVVELPCDENRVNVQISLEEYETNVRIRLIESEGTAKLTEISYRNAQKYNDVLIWYFLWAAGAAVCWAVLRKKNRESREIFVCLAGVTFLAMLPYMNSFLPTGGDLEFHLLRIEGIYEGLKNGEVPMMVNSNQSNGFGYISPTMYPQMLLYIPALFRMAGMSLLNSYKILLWIGTILTVIVAYFSFRKILRSSWGGMVACSFYTLGLYRLTNVYCRAAVGEFLAMAFLPLIFYGMYEILAGNEKNWIWAAVGFTLTFQQHMLTLEISLIFTFLVCIGCTRRLVKEPGRAVSLLKAACVTILLNIGTILPILSFMREDLNIYDFTELRYLPDVVVYLSEVFATFVKMEGNQMLRGTTFGEMPLSVGGILLVAVIGFIIYCYKRRDIFKIDEEAVRLKKLGTVCCVIGAVAILMTMWVFPWSLLTKISVIDKLISSIQFLSRLLMIPAMTFCLVAGILTVYLMKEHSAKKSWIVGLMYVSSILVILYPLESMIQHESYKSRREVESLSYTDDLYLYNGDSQNPLLEMGKRIWLSDGTDIGCRNLSRKGTKVTCDLEIGKIGKDAYIELPLYYYPQYKVQLNGNVLAVEKGENGLVRAYLPQGCESGRLEAFYKIPIDWYGAKLVAVVTLLCIIVVCCSRTKPIKIKKSRREVK